MAQQDWIAFMSQPYRVEVKVEVELRLILLLFIDSKTICKFDFAMSYEYNI